MKFTKHSNLILNYPVLENDEKTKENLKKVQGKYNN